MKNSNIEFVTFPSEIALVQIKNLADLYPEIKNKYFVVLVVNRNGPDLFKIRRVNYNGLVSTAKWCCDEESRTDNYWNNFDSGNDNRPSHHCRGLTSYIPELALVDLVIEIHDNKITAEKTKEVLSRLEANLCRRPPETYPALKKLMEGKHVPRATVTAERTKDTRYNIMSMMTTE